jgi:hypothetical protein
MSETIKRYNNYQNHEMGSSAVYIQAMRAL